VRARVNPASPIRRSAVAALALAIVALAAPDGFASGPVPAAPGGADGGDAAVWAALKSGGHAVLIRHATAPGTGDPPRFSIGDCATQRNLSDEGRAQARAIGDAFRAAGVSVDRVLSSRWCRAADTAALLALGPVEPFPPLDSFFRNRDDGPAATDATRQAIAQLGRRTVVMVTHQVNITALTGIFPGSAEAIVVAPSPDGEQGIRVVGRLRF
jgi:broad specificity phosphatase PhoE